MCSGEKYKNLEIANDCFRFAHVAIVFEYNCMIAY